MLEPGCHACWTSDVRQNKKVMQFELDALLDVEDKYFERNIPQHYILLKSCAIAHYGQ